MSMLIDGDWRDEPATAGQVGRDGAYRRRDSVIRNWVTRDGAPGPTGVGGFPAAAGRYHLYVAIACPWAHRTLIIRKLKRLEDVISLSVVSPSRTDQGWVFEAQSPAHRDDALGTDYLHQVYTRAAADYTGRVTVPVLWDKERQTIVNNESAEIIRMLNDAFDEFTDEGTDYRPAALRDEIDAVNRATYANVNNGVYRAGFATNQAAYEQAFDQLFQTLDDLDQRLGQRRYLIGDRLTEADWRLFPTLVRFDVAYYGAFKCNLRRIADYDNLSGYTRELYQMPGIAETVDLETYKRGYYSLSEQRNPTGIVPKGPAVDLDAPHGRDALEG